MPGQEDLESAAFGPLDIYNLGPEAISELVPSRVHGLVNRAEFFTAFGVQGVGAAEQAFRERVERQEGVRVANGILAQVIRWDGYFMYIGAFDPTSGLQVGIGQAFLDRDPRGGDIPKGYLMYRTAFIIAPQYQRRGYGMLLRQYLENYIASNLESRAVAFQSSIQAVAKSKKRAAQRILQATGAVQSKHDPETFLKIFFKNQAMRVPGLLTFDNVVLRPKHSQMDIDRFQKRNPTIRLTELIEVDDKGIISFIGGTGAVETHYWLMKMIMNKGYRVQLKPTQE